MSCATVLCLCIYYQLVAQEVIMTYLYHYMVQSPASFGNPQPSSWRRQGRSPAEILGSNPTGGMDICLL